MNPAGSSPRRPRGALLKLTLLLVLALGAATTALSLPGCEGAGAPGASLGSVGSDLVGGCPCSGDARHCKVASYSDIPADGIYYVTTFAEGGPLGCTRQPADGTWPYIADSARYGCGAKVKMEANGKSCIALVADCGPNICVEQAAGQTAKGDCSHPHPIIDASPFITSYLYGISSAGWSDHTKVKVTLVDAAAKIGCPGEGMTAPPDPGGSTGGPGCKSDTECNHNTPGEGVVCDTAANMGKGACIDGCRSNTDCPNMGACSASAGHAIGGCSDAGAKLGTKCTTDADCAKGMMSSGRVCSTDSGTCIVGCHADTDCGMGGTCEHSLHPYTCVTRKQLGESCSNDKECSGGVGGTQRVCGNDGTCLDACHKDADCLTTEKCDHTNNPWKCLVQHPSGDAGVDDSCVITYPSGVAIQGVPVPDSVTAEYSARGCETGFKCMIDTRAMKDAKTGKPLSYDHVKVGPHFTLRELSASSAAKSPYVFVDPSLVEHLEAGRAAYGKPFTITSGFRSAAHQRATCMGNCGSAVCYGSSGEVTCAKCSRHMYGTAADMPHSSPKCDLASTCCNAGSFDFVYNEKAGGDHLHVEMKKAHRSPCLYQAISCK